MDATLLIELSAVVVAAAAIIVGLRGVRNQLWVQTFSEYTRRYGEIVRSLPSEARRPGGSFSLDALDPAERGELLNTVRAYLNLCSEEFWLHRHRRIDKQTWTVWRSGMEETSRLPWIRETWDVLRCEYEYFEEFRDFFDSCIAARPSHGPGSAVATEA